MSALVWLCLVGFLCSVACRNFDHGGKNKSEALFGYEMVEYRLEDLTLTLSELINTVNKNRNETNERINEIMIASNKRLSDLSAFASKIQNAIDQKSSTIATKIDDHNSRLEKIETMDKAIVRTLEQNNNGIESKYSRLIDRLTTLEITGDTILSKQRSTETRINDITTGISTLNSQSKQILKNHDDLIITSCDMPTVTGKYRLQIPNINVHCDMTVLGGRWLYIQRRISTDVISFERNWFNYIIGFGEVGAQSSFWLGLEAIHQITNSGNYELHIGIRNEHDEYKEARYSQFKVSGINDGYRLTIGGYSGTAGNNLNNNAKFSTFDTDNDSSSTKNCAKDFHSGWWFTDCRASNLNGPYVKASNGFGIEWGSWADAATFSNMMIRRK